MHPYSEKQMIVLCVVWKLNWDYTKGSHQDTKAWNRVKLKHVISVSKNYVWKQKEALTEISQAMDVTKRKSNA